MKKERAEYLYVVSNKLEPEEALTAYKERWAIEVLFGHLKKKGLNFESTHLSDKHKLDKLMAVLTSSLSLYSRLGAHLERKP